MPSLPAVSVTLTSKVLAVVKVRARLQVLLPTVVLAAAQVLPLSMDTRTDSPTERLALKVPLMVWAAVRVMKSLLALPVSALSVAVAMVVVGATVSKVALSALLAALVLPAMSVKVARKVLLPSLPHCAALRVMSTKPASVSALRKVTLAKVVSASLSAKVSPTCAVAAVAGKPTRTVVLLAISVMLSWPSVNLLLPNSIRLGAGDAVVSKVKPRLRLAAPKLPAPSRKRADSDLTPSLPSTEASMLKST